MSDYKDTVFARYVISVIAAWTAEAVTYPVDLIKTRLQIQNEIALAKEGFKPQYRGLIKSAVGVVKEEGILKLWGGLVPMLQRHLVYAGSRLVFYEEYKKRMIDEHNQMSMLVSSAGGIGSGMLAQFIASPADLVKVQMQAEGHRRLQGQPPRFKNCTHAYRVLYTESGLMGFWRGAIPNMQRAAMVNLGDLAAYDYTKRLLINEYNMSDGFLCHTISAFTAGFIAAVLGTPADVLKTRLMNQPVGPDGKGKLYHGMIDCFKLSVKNEGLIALYKGFLPMWLRLGPWALIYWLAFEHIQIAIGGKTF